MLRIFWLLLIWPFRLIAFIYLRARSLHRDLIVEIDIRGEYSEAPLSHGLWAYVKPARDRFYLLALDLQNLITASRTAKLRVKRARITIEANNLGWAQAWEVRSLLQALKSAGVETHAYLLSDSRSSLFIASACDRVFSPESATFDLTAFTSESVFVQSLLAKLGVRPQFLSVGEFKSAAEIFTRKGMSPQARKQSEELIADLEQQFWLAINSKTGKLSRKKNDGLYSAAMALDAGLIDGICGLTEFQHAEAVAKKWRVIDLYAALKIFRRSKFPLMAFRRRKRIALLVAEGNIVESTEPRPGTINWRDYSTVGSVLKDQRVDAALLRINSPGGSATVSQLLWREWMLATGRTRLGEKEPKHIPMYVSQGNVAASGGYYLSAAGTTVYSTPMTITGSIGVVGGKFNVAPLLNKWGITIDKAPKNNPSPVFSAFSDYSAANRKMISVNMQDIYTQFIRDVAIGRNMNAETVRSLASGRVYSGDRAGKNGLIDAAGGITQTLLALKTKLGLSIDESIDLVIMPGVKEPLISRSLIPLGLSRILGWADFAKPGVYLLEAQFMQA